MVHSRRTRLGGIGRDHRDGRGGGDGMRRRGRASLARRDRCASGGARRAGRQGPARDWSLEARRDLRADGSRAPLALQRRDERSPPRTGVQRDRTAAIRPLEGHSPVPARGTHAPPGRRSDPPRFRSATTTGEQMTMRRAAPTIVLILGLIANAGTARADVRRLDHREPRRPAGQVALA